MFKRIFKDSTVLDNMTRKQRKTKLLSYGKVVWADVEKMPNNLCQNCGSYQTIVSG